MFTVIHVVVLTILHKQIRLCLSYIIRVKKREIAQTNKEGREVCAMMQSCRGGCGVQSKRDRLVGCLSIQPVSLWR